MLRHLYALCDFHSSRALTLESAILNYILTYKFTRKIHAIYYDFYEFMHTNMKHTKQARIY